MILSSNYKRKRTDRFSTYENTSSPPTSRSLSPSTSFLSVLELPASDLINDFVRDS